MQRLNSKKIINTYFENSAYLKPGVDVWKTLSLASKQTMREFVTRVQDRVTKSDSMEDRLSAFMALIPKSLAKDVAAKWATDPDRVQYLRPGALTPALNAPPAAAAKPLPFEHVRGAAEASITSSSKKRERAPELKSIGQPTKKSSKVVNTHDVAPKAKCLRITLLCPWKVTEDRHLVAARSPPKISKRPTNETFDMAPCSVISEQPRSLTRPD
jgi:hypothetical protein